MGNKAPAKLESGKLRVKSIGSGVLPVELASIVAEYLSGDRSDYVKAALVGVQPINFRLSQDSNSLPKYNDMSLGLVSREYRWNRREFYKDKQIKIKDKKVCLRFLEQTNSNYCRVDIEFLEVRLVMHNSSCGNAWEDLRNTIKALGKHLVSVKGVVILIGDDACCFFSLKEVIDTGTKVLQPVDESKSLFEIIDDLQTCWQTNYLTPESVFDFYFKSSVPQTSEKYLLKFICDSATPFAGELLKEEALCIPSSKIMWVLDVNRCADKTKLPDYTRLCRAVYFNGPSDINAAEQIFQSSKNAFCYRDNPYVERIVINNILYGQVLQLPSPSTPLEDFSPRSALIELTLEGSRNAIHLTHLNNGYFPHLRHLSVVGGRITGHLDSHRVPLLKTLILEPGIKKHESFLEAVQSFIRERVQPLLRCGRPWQVVATQTNGGWSFASYDVPTSNPQNEVKEDSPFSSASLHALPRIRELVLVASTQENVDEWQNQLTGFPSLEAAKNDHKDRILVWEPQCVEKIFVMGAMVWTNPRLLFTEEIPKNERILTSLECYNVSVEVDGNVLPLLQLLEASFCCVKLSGAFPHLQTLKFWEATLQSQWHVNAPLLQILHCSRLKDGQLLSLCPEWLPQLSYLKILLFEDDPSNCPVILNDKGSLGFSRLNRVKFGFNMALTPFLDQYKGTSVSNLELNLNVLESPADWHHGIWQCETLTIHLFAPKSKNMQSPETPVEVRLPYLLQVKTLTVTETNCRVLVDKEMPNLTVCSVGSPKSLIPLQRCPALKRIRFTDKLSENDKKRALDPATFTKIGLRPSEIIFAADYQLHTTAWAVVPNENDVLPLDGPLARDEDSYVFC